MADRLDILTEEIKSMRKKWSDCVRGLPIASKHSQDVCSNIVVLDLVVNMAAGIPRKNNEPAQAPKEITKEYFIEKVGTEPIHDDLERCNCDQAGKQGHSSCGWCIKCDQPVFCCGHFFPEYSKTGE